METEIELRTDNERLRAWLTYISTDLCLCNPKCQERGADFGCQVGMALQALAGAEPPVDWRSEVERLIRSTNM